MKRQLCCLTKSTFKGTVGPCVSTMQLIYVALQDWVLMEALYRQIGGPNEKSTEDIWNGPKRRVSFAIFEINWGTFAVSSSGYFSREEPQKYEEMTRARMSVTRVCIYHIDNVEAGKSHSITGECLAHMMYECVVHQVTIIGGDGSKMAYQKQGHFSFGWTDLSRQLMHISRRLSRKSAGT